MEPRDTTNSTSQRGDGSSGAGRSDEPSHRIKQAGKDAASDARREVRSRLEEGKREVRSRLDEGRRSAASAATDAQHAVDDAGARLADEGHETLAQAAYAASERISSLAHYVETHSLDELMQQARRMARRNPALMIAGGAALGFAISRFFKASSADAEYDEYMDYGPEDGPEEWPGSGDYSTADAGTSAGAGRAVQSWPEGRYGDADSGDSVADRGSNPSL